MQDKIQTEKDRIIEEQNNNPGNVEITWQVMEAMDEEAIERVIEDKDLDMAIEDYEDLESLKEAVAEELEIEIPDSEEE